MKTYFRYYLYRLFQIIFKITANFILKYFLILLAKVAYTFNKEHRHVADVNLNLAYKDKLSNDEKNKIVYKSYVSLFFNLFEFMENQYISKKQLIQKANLINEDVILTALNEKRKIIFVTAHYGGWELAIPYIAIKYGTLAVVNRKMDNPLINDMYIKARDRNNIIMLDKKVAAKGMLKAFKNDNFVAVAIDQHTKYGVKINFFDKEVMATDVTARLALKFDAVIIPVFAVLNDFRDYDIKIYDALDVRNIDFKTDDKIKELTQIQANVIEKQIINKPELWFWQHKRWKKFYKNLYSRG